MSLCVDVPASAAVAARLAAWDRAEVSRRIWARDATVWGDPPRPEVADRLGWLAAARAGAGRLHGVRALAAGVDATGVTDVLLLGMGGSSLAPQMFASVFGAAPGHPALRILDSTHPDAVHALATTLDPARTLFVVASKSGTTLETRSFLETFWARAGAAIASPGEHFVAVTDPGTPLAALAAERGFRAVLEAPPEVGGRFSALTEFGLLPAALLGIDLDALLAGAAAAADACGPEVAATEHPALRLGAFLGESARAGRDKLLLRAATDLGRLPDWTEQLVAESLGKDGTGIVPVPNPTGSSTGPDRVTLALATEAESPRGDATIAVAGPEELGGMLFVLEMAVAAAGIVLEVDPFDQPDVELAKAFARTAMEEGFSRLDVAETTLDDPDVGERLAALLSPLSPPGYLALHAYLAPSPETTAALERIRARVARATGAVTTAGYGPRFLHSTGQLHKGGPPEGAFLQIVDHPHRDVPVPGTGYGFGKLIAAQAFGDQAALRSRGRPVLMICLGEAGPADLPRLERAVAAALA